MKFKCRCGGTQGRFFCYAVARLLQTVYIAGHAANACSGAAKSILHSVCSHHCSILLQKYGYLAGMLGAMQGAVQRTWLSAPLPSTSLGSAHSSSPRSCLQQGDTLWHSTPQDSVANTVRLGFLQHTTAHMQS
jgi:hypothetical protein